MATWLSTLPDPLVPGYGLNPIDQVIHTDMEGGGSRSRRRSAARKDKVSCSWKFTDAQFALFRDWFDDDVAGADGGAAWFTISLPVGATGIDSVEAKFAGIWQSKPISGLLTWEVSATLEVRN